MSDYAHGGPYDKYRTPREHDWTPGYDPKPYAPPLPVPNITFNTDDVDQWTLAHVATREFHGPVISDLYADAAVWLRTQEEHGFIVVTGSNLQINEDDTYDLTISVEVT